MKEQIISYLKEKVLGKVLKTDNTVYFSDEGKLENVYSDKMIFSDLLLTENGLQFNMTTVTEEKVYRLNEKGERSDIRKDFTGTSVFHYEIAMRKSSGELTGYMRLISSTVPDHTMEAVIYGVSDFRLENNELKWKEQQLFYRDIPSQNEKFRAVAFDSEIRFYIENEKLIFKYSPVCFDVNTFSMSKTLSENKLPSFISKEI